MGSEEGLTPLHCAALAGSAACARLLLDAKADPQLAAADGRCSIQWNATAALGLSWGHICHVRPCMGSWQALFLAAERSPTAALRFLVG